MARSNYPRRIIVHCSASNWGTWKDIDRWHKERGWGQDLEAEYKAQWILRYGFLPARIHIGYHAVICNGFPSYSNWANGEGVCKFDGKIEPGRPDQMPGAHCPGHNYDSLAVCLIGNPGFSDYTDAQWASLVHWCAVKCRQYQIAVRHIGQHSQHDRKKPFCASIHVDQLMSDVADSLR